MRISLSLLLFLSLTAPALSAVRNKRQYAYSNYYNNYQYYQPQRYGYDYRQPYTYGFHHRQPYAYGYSQPNYGNYGGYSQPSYRNNYYQQPSVTTTYYNSDGMVYSNEMDAGNTVYYNNPYRGGMGGGGILGAASALLQNVIG